MNIIYKCFYNNLYLTYFHGNYYLVPFNDLDSKTCLNLSTEQIKEAIQDTKTALVEVKTHGLKF